MEVWTMKYKFLSLFLALGMLLVLASGCGSPAAEGETPSNKIGISMPNDSDAKWAADAEIMHDQLTAAGYDVNIQFAGDSVDAQLEQLRDMIAAGYKTLIVAAVDPSALAPAFSADDGRVHISGGSASSASSGDGSDGDGAYDGLPVDDGINLIAYDRLITNSDAVDYYVGFDSYETGYLQAHFIEDYLSLYDADGTTYTIELFFASANSIDTFFQYQGAMDVLRVYLDSGVLQIPSGQDSIQDCVTDGREDAKARMGELLASSDRGINLDAVFCANDQIALGVTDALFEGYTGGVYPLLSGLGCDEQSVNNLLTGKQGMTLLKDYTGMAQEAVSAAIAFASGGAPESGDSLDTGIVNVPASLFYPEEVFASNYQDMLITRGYFADNGDGTVRSITDYTMGYTGSAEASN